MQHEMHHPKGGSAFRVLLFYSKNEPGTHLFALLSVCKCALSADNMAYNPQGGYDPYNQYGGARKY